MPHEVVTRFAPSPTGALHVGGARTALYCWAFARQHRADGGRFILRFEDTDRARSSPESTRGIMADLRWLGLDWDEGPDPDADDPYDPATQRGERGPYFQSQRLELYNEYIDALLRSDRAFNDGDAIRFRATEDVTFDDVVYGRITVKAADIGDFVIRKSDGFPTFHFAVVVDDAMMRVSHVIRGQEHLSNTPKHAALHRALGFEPPIFAHTPSIMNPDGSKMSKRDKAKVARAAAQAHGLQSVGFDDDRFSQFLDKQTDAVDIAQAIAQKLGVQLPEIDVADFRRSGYLPEVLLNYVALLGWNPGGDVERFDKDFMIERFSLDRVNKANSRFDREKLFRFNADTIAAMPKEQFAERLREHLRAFHPEFDRLVNDEHRFALFCEAYQPRARTLSEPATLGRFLIAPRIEQYADKAVKKNLLASDGAGLAVLEELLPKLGAIEPWSGEAAEQAVRELAEAKGIGMGKVAQPLRVAISGDAVTPPLDVTLEILGRDATLTRLRDCLAAFASQRPGTTPHA